MLSTIQNYKMANRKYVKQNLRFYFCPCFWENLLPLLNHPLLTLSHWPLVSITLTTKFMQLSNWYVRQYSTMSNRIIQYGNTLFLNDNVLWWNGKKHISSSQWMMWKKVIKITCKYAPWQYFYSLINVTFSCPCAQHEGVLGRGGTTPHIHY
jgi:hypothetical protein